MRDIDDLNLYGLTKVVKSLTESLQFLYSQTYLSDKQYTLLKECRRKCDQIIAIEEYEETGWDYNEF